MKVSFSKRTSSLDDGTREDILRRIYFALSRYSPRIDEVTVQIGELVAARAGTQRLFRLSVRMKRIGSFAIESVEDEVATAVSRAAERAAKRVQRILDRLRNETRRAKRKKEP